MIHCMIHHCHSETVKPRNIERVEKISHLTMAAGPKACPISTKIAGNIITRLVTNKTSFGRQASWGLKQCAGMQKQALVHFKAAVRIVDPITNLNVDVVIDALLCPDLRKGLLATSSLCAKGYGAVFKIKGFQS